MGSKDERPHSRKARSRASFDLEAKTDESVRDFLSRGPSSADVLSFAEIANRILPVLTMSITYAIYTLVQKKQLTAATGKHSPQ